MFTRQVACSLFQPMVSMSKASWTDSVIYGMWQVYVYVCAYNMPEIDT